MARRFDWHHRALVLGIFMAESIQRPMLVIRQAKSSPGIRFR
jgi:hypothetical protein